MDGSRACPSCGAPIPDDHRFCGNCGQKVEPVTPGAAARTMFFGTMQTPGRAKLVLIKGGGMDGVAYHLNSTEHVVGRLDGAILFPEDLMLSPKHSNFVYQAGTLVVRAGSSRNGIFLRIRNPAPLQSGDTFLVGEQ